MTKSEFSFKGYVHKSKLMEALDTHTTIEDVFDACTSLSIDKASIMLPFLIEMLSSNKISHRYLAVDFLTGNDYDFGEHTKLRTTLKDAASHEENRSILSLYKAVGIIGG